MLKWLRVSGFAVVDDLFQNQIGNGCAHIAALVIGRKIQSGHDVNDVTKIDIRQCDTNSVLGDAHGSIGRLPTDERWLCDDEIRHILSFRLNLNPGELDGLVFYGSHTAVLSTFFPTHFAQHNAEPYDLNRFTS